MQALLSDKPPVIHYLSPVGLDGQTEPGSDTLIENNKNLPDEFHAGLDFPGFTTDTKGGLMTHKNRERGHNATVTGSLQKDESHGSGVLGEAAELHTWTNGLDTDDCVYHAHSGQDVTAGAVDVHSDNGVSGRHGIKFLNEPGSRDIVYFTDKPDEVVLAELDHFERLNADDWFLLAAGYWEDYE